MQYGQTKAQSTHYSVHSNGIDLVTSDNMILVLLQEPSWVTTAVGLSWLNKTDVDTFPLSYSMTDVTILCTL